MTRTLATLWAILLVFLAGALLLAIKVGGLALNEQLGPSDVTQLLTNPFRARAPGRADA